MLCKAIIPAVVASLTIPLAHANGACNAGLMGEYQEVATIVRSLHPDKPAQMRVYAVDGSEFTAAQAHWMQVQMQKIEQSCRDASAEDQAQLAQRLAEVRKLWRSRRTAS